MASPRLHVVDTIGKGGFGVVMRAWLEGDHGFVKEVAVKLLSPEASQEAHLLHRLRDEARLMALVNHRAVVRADGLTMLGGRWAVVMEFVHGVSLSRLIRRKGSLPLRVSIELLAEIASALAAIHDAVDPSGEPLEILHRDVKPGNVQLTATGDVKLLDFGNARADYDAREARTEQLTYGTLAYMAPERFTGREEPAGDVYSLGAMAFELLSARRFGRSGEDEEEHRAQRRKRIRWMADFLGPQGAPTVRLLNDMLRFDESLRPSPASVERALLEMAQSIQGPSLRLWAMDHVPELVRTTRTPWTPSTADADDGPNTTWIPMSPTVTAPDSRPRMTWPGPASGPSQPASIGSHARTPTGPDRKNIRHLGAPKGPPGRSADIASARVRTRRPAPPEAAPTENSTPNTAEPASPRPTPVTVSESVTTQGPVRARFNWWLGGMAAAAGLSALIPFLIMGSAAVLAATDSLAREWEGPQSSIGSQPGTLVESADWPEVEARPIEDGTAGRAGGVAWEPESIEPLEVEPERPATPPVLAVREARPGGSVAPEVTPATRSQRRSSSPSAIRTQAATSPEDTQAEAETGRSRPRRPTATRTEAEPPAAPARSSVSLRGDVERAVLIGTTGERFSIPGAVPPGTYSVLVTFPNQSPATAGTVRVNETSSLELECLSRFALCRPS